MPGTGNILSMMLEPTAQGRMRQIRRECGDAASDAHVLCRFIENEYTSLIIGMASGILYMTDPCSEHILHGKIILEMYSSEKMYFEIDVSKKTDFTQIQEKQLKERIQCNEYSYSNIKLEYRQVIPFVQEVLFLGLFRQRFLMTTASRAMGSMSIQRLISGNGQLFAFRKCVLAD